MALPTLMSVAIQPVLYHAHHQALCSHQGPQCNLPLRSRARHPGQSQGQNHPQHQDAGGFLNRVVTQNRLDGPEVAHDEPGGAGGTPSGEHSVGEEAAAVVKLAEVDGRDDGHREELQMNRNRRVNVKQPKKGDEGTNGCQK